MELTFHLSIECLFVLKRQQVRQQLIYVVVALLVAFWFVKNVIVHSTKTIVPKPILYSFETMVLRLTNCLSSSGRSGIVIAHDHTTTIKLRRSDIVITHERICRSDGAL